VIKRKKVNFFNHFTSIQKTLKEKIMNYTRILILFQLFFQLLIADVFEGYTLFTPGQGGGGGGNSTTYLMDHNSNVIHTWAHNRSPASMPYLFPDSTIIYPYRVPNPSMNAGGVGGGISKLTWDGTTLWDYQFANDTYQHHHDVEPLPNGNVLIIVWERKTAAEAYAMGRQTINNPLNQMWSEAVLELDPETGNVVWEWHLWDHLCQDVSSSYPNYVNVSEHPELFDINNGNVGNSGGPGGANADWMHLNAIAYHAELDQIVLSSRHQDEIFIIDHSTTTEEASGHSGGNSGMGGDLLYRWGNPQNYDRGNNTDHILDAQHGVNWIPSEYPGEGNFILFNNGHTNNASAVLEFIPPLNSNGTYDVSPNEPFGPENAIWVYTAGSSLQSDVQSGAFRLPNGNTLITEADDAYIFEVNSSGSVQWTYTHPGNDIMIARAQKYGLDYFDQNNEMTVIVDYAADWNMVGLPVFVENPSHTILFPDAVEGTLYSFSGGYIQENELTAGIGYWLRFLQSGMTQITGGPVNELIISLNVDWNLISGFSFPVSINSIFDPQNLIVPGTIYGFDEGYVNVDELVPGQGYWLRSTEEGEITLSSTPSAGRPKSFQPPQHANTLRIGSQMLYFGTEIENPLSLSLPPKPPIGAIDFRFSGDTKLCSEDECLLEVMNDGQPLTFECEIIDGEVWEIINESGNVFECSSISVIELSGESETFVLRKSASLPTPLEFALFPAHPNPFNPTTTINFNVPELSLVNLVIYNIQGQLVEPLVEKLFSSGKHTVQWNASEFSSGVYFLRLETENFNTTQKIVFMK
jgi:hypothetical protein